MWLKELKIAVIEKNPNKFKALLEELPKLTDAKEREEALYLIEAAKEIVTSLKDDTQTSMIRLKKNIDFLNSARADAPAKFDITS